MHEDKVFGQAEGGTIAAKRKAEKGMIFKVTLPLIIGE